MIYRFMFVGYTDDPSRIKIREGLDCYVALSVNTGKVFMYVETRQETVDPELLADGEMIPYPNGKKWDMANEIFHYSRPVSDEQWHRKIEYKKPHVMVNYLKPDKVSSYIYYHYQYQEEYPGDGDRYGIIYLHGQQIIFYLEDPVEVETEEISGSLTTMNTPKTQWSELMNMHFVDRWRDIEILEYSQTTILFKNCNRDLKLNS